MINMLLYTFTILLLFAVAAGTTCYDYYNYQYECYNGCCGTYYNRYCCLESNAIAGIVVGSLAALAVLSVFICICIRYKTRRSVLVMQSPATASSSIAVVNNTQQMQQYPTYNYQTAPSYGYPNVNQQMYYNNTGTTTGHLPQPPGYTTADLPPYSN